jgi:phage terminase large subunit
VLDYNPSDEYHWVFDKVIPREDADFHITTYKDNPFLSKELIEEIERLKDADENYWLVYGLGQKGNQNDTIYTHWKPCKTLPEGETVYGLDFGFNNPSALVKVVFHDGAIYADEVLYETKLTTNDLVERINLSGISRYDEIFCDSAEPKTIEELVRCGYNAKPSNKDVFAGIQKIKSLPLFVTETSVNLIKELRNYKWKTDKNGKRLDEPVKFNDHIADAMRYCVYTKLNAPQLTWGMI